MTHEVFTDGKKFEIKREAGKSYLYVGTDKIKIPESMDITPLLINFSQKVLSSLNCHKAILVFLKRQSLREAYRTQNRNPFLPTYFFIKRSDQDVLDYLETATKKGEPAILQLSDDKYSRSTPEHSVIILKSESGEYYILEKFGFRGKYCLMKLFDRLKYLKSVWGDNVALGEIKDLRF